MTDYVHVRDPITFVAARVTSPDQTATPEWGIAVTPQRAGNPQGVRSSILAALNFDASRTWTDLTTTTLSAGASFTSSSVDGLNYAGVGIFIRSDQPVSVELQESFDGSTFASSFTYYMGFGPGTAFHGIITFTPVHRYYRVVVTNIGDAAQTTFRVSRVTYASPVPIYVSPLRAVVQRTTTALGANASWTGRSISTANIREITVSAFADQAGTLNIDESHDGTTWRTTRSVSVSANTAAVLTATSFAYRLARVRYVNGGTAQSTFDLQYSVVNAVI